MDIFLTDEELQRETDLFGPWRERYESLQPRTCEIEDFVPDTGEDGDRPKPPPSC